MDFNVEKYLSNMDYINKDFPSLWNEILETVPKLTNKWIPSESNESDPLVVWLKELAIIADKLNYNIDKNILELFPATLTQLRCAYNVYDTLGYTPDWYISATTDVTIIYTGLVNGELPSNTASPVQVKIPKFTQVSNDDSTVIYTTLDDVIVTAGVASQPIVPAIEGTLNDFTINGSNQITYSNLDSQRRLFFNNVNIAQNGIIVSNYSDFRDYSYTSFFMDISNVESGAFINDVNVNSQVWKRVTNLNQYEANSKVFKLGIDSITNTVYIQFPEDIGTLIGDGLYIKYILSSGSSGNIGRGDLTKFINITEFTSEPDDEDSTTLSASTDFTINNSKSTQNGADPLSIDEMRNQFNKVVGTFSTLVTIKDYENYLYNYTDSSGNNIVSNIRVSDRYNDLYNTLKIESLTIDVDGSNSIADKVVVIDRPEGTAGGETVYAPAMTAYELKLYPLLASSTIENKDSFDLTFDKGSNVNTQLLALTNSITNNVDGVLNTAKCISHDFIPYGTPILIPYDLNGQLFLQTTVSSVEASEILSNVTLSLYKTLNSHELNWGKMIDYGAVVDSIKASDSRIQYVALNSIVYDTPEIINENQGESGDLDGGYDVTVRTILSGYKPWTEYSPYSFSYDQSDGAIYGYVEGGTSPTQNKISQIQTVVEITEDDGANTYLVGKNEAFTVLAPKYRVITTYSNYLYYIAVTNAESDENTPLTINANTPTKLSEGTSILIFTNRDKAQNYIDDQSSGADYTISAGNLIQSSTKITFINKNSLSVRDVQTTGSSVTISVLDYDTGTLKATQSYSVSLGNTISNKLRVATTSEGLVEALATAGTPYTLLNGEYLFYTDSFGLELGIIGEGATISSKIAINDLTLIDSQNSSDFNKLLSGDLSSVLSYTMWTEVNDDVIEYKMNELYTFGENYLISCLGTDTNHSPVGFLSVGDVSNKIIQLNKDNISSIRYQLIADGDVKNYDDSKWTTISKISEDDSYSVLIRLSLICGPGLPQQLISTSNNISFGNNSELKTYDKEQQLKITFSGESATEETITSSYVQSSLLVPYQGGLPLKMVTTEETLINFYTYKLNNSETINNLPINNEFILLNKIVGGGDFSPITLSLPTTNNSSTLVVIAYADSSRSVNYILADSSKTTISVDSNDSGAIVATISGGDNKITDIYYLGIPHVVNSGATYYDQSTSSKQPVSSILGDSAFIVLDNKYIYDNRFSPIYVPSDESIISEPTSPEAYFLSNHPYNKYVMPWLRNINIKISQQSLGR